MPAELPASCWHQDALTEAPGKKNCFVLIPLHAVRPRQMRQGEKIKCLSYDKNPDTRIGIELQVKANSNG